MEDREIVDLYWQRREDAIQETAAKYGGYCLSIAQNILSSAEDAEECAWDAYLRAWNAIPPKRPDCLRLYLGRITRNLALDRWKAGKTEKRGGGRPELALEELGECLTAKGSPEDALDRKLLTDALNVFLRLQPPLQRKLFVCRYWYLDSIQDMAGRFSLSESQVKAMLHRMRKKLKRYLEKEGISL